jgi:hypothetical protein
LARERARGSRELACFFFCALKGPPKQKEKKTRNKKKIDPKKQPTDFPLFFSFFLGAPCVGCGPSVDMPPHMGTRSWL